MELTPADKPDLPARRQPSTDVRPPDLNIGPYAGRRPARLRRFTLLIGVLLWAVFPIAAFIHLTGQSSQAELAPAENVWASVDANDQPIRRPISLSIERSSPQELYAPEWSGVVQETTITPGAVVSSGDVLAIVGNVARVGYASARPFTSPLSVGSKGDEVRQLLTFLRDRGLPAPDADVYSRATESSVRKFAESIGVANPKQVTTFEPGWVIFLPAQKVQVAESSVNVGTPAPPAGTVLATAEAGIVSARLTEPTTETTSVPAEPDEGDPPEDSNTEVQPLENGLTAAPGEVLHVGSDVVPLSAELDAVAPEGFESLRILIEPGALSARATLESPPAEGSWAVPSSAIVATDDGQVCVVVKGASPIAVAPIGNSPGKTIVTGDLTRGTKVLVSPGSSDRRCD